MTDPRLPVTLLTGFLGAGKTTVLNALLSDASAGRIAVVVNEFGEAGLDHDLIETVGEDVALMSSGCLCCTLNGELSTTMGGLVARCHAGMQPFERVVIETTGMADPGPILQTLVSDRYLARTTRMDGVVTVADAANGPATLDTQFEAVQQAAMADMIVVSKTDLAPALQTDAFEARLRALNPRARIVRAVKGDGLAGQLWGLSGLRRGVAPADALAWATGFENDPLDNLSGLSRPAAPEPRHDGRIVTASIEIDHPLSDTVFDGWLRTMVSLRGDKLLRVKGIVFLEGMPTPFVFHGVQNIFDPPVPLPDWPGTDRRSRIVVIARDVPERRLRTDLDMLRARPTPPPENPFENEAL